MYIKEIELNNFRIYKGVNKLSLEPHDGKNIIVISGDNGFGKTTFLVSLVWCLYGKNMQRVDDIYQQEISKDGNYQKYIAASLNKQAETEGETRFYVKIILTDVKVEDIPCSVEITRSYDTIKGEETLSVKLDEKKQELISDLSSDKQKGEEIFIRDYIMPEAIAKFFFFDAEKITSLAEVIQKEHNRDLSMAYSEVLGIKKYEQLKEDLETQKDEYRKNSASKEDKEKLNTLEADIKNTIIEIEDTEKSISGLNEDINIQKKKEDVLSTKLIKDGATIGIEELGKLRKNLSDAEQEKLTQEEKFKELYDYIPFAIAGECLALVQEQVKHERILSEQKFKYQDIDEKIRRIRQEIEDGKKEINFTIDVKTSDYFNKQIELLVKKYFYSDVLKIDENISILHQFTENQESELNQLIQETKNKRDVLDIIHNQYSKAKYEYQKISRDINDAEKKGDSDFVASLRKDKEKISRLISEKEQEIGAKKQRIKDLGEQLKKYRQEQTTLRTKIDAAADYSQKEEKVGDLISILDKFIEQLKKQEKKSLEEKMLETLQRLLHKKRFVSRIDVDILSSECIDINLYDPDDKKIAKSGLSMGERQLYASALLGSLVSESEIEFPVFIDSPMQKLDKDHADNIVKYFYPSVSKQVVIFPLLKTELREDNYALMRDNICKTVLIKNLTPNSSKFEEIETSQLFKTI